MHEGNTVKDYNNLIVEYELSRKVLHTLKTTYIKKFECMNFFEGQVYKTCKETAFDLVKEDNECDGGIYYSHYYSYKDEFEVKLDDIGCDACKLSHKFKTGPLAEARQKFGRAKTALSAAARSLTLNTVGGVAEKEAAKIMSEL